MDLAMRILCITFFRFFKEINLGHLTRTILYISPMRVNYSSAYSTQLSIKFARILILLRQESHVRSAVHRIGSASKRRKPTRTSQFDEKYGALSQFAENIFRTGLPVIVTLFEIVGIYSYCIFEGCNFTLLQTL